MCSYMLQIITAQLLTAEHGASIDTTVLLFHLPARKPSSASESTPVLFPTTRTCPKFTDKVPDDIIPAVKHSGAHFPESFLREQDDYMRNRTTTFPIKDNMKYFSKYPIWIIGWMIQREISRNAALRPHWRAAWTGASEYQSRLCLCIQTSWSWAQQLHPCHAGNPCTKKDQYQGKNTHWETKRSSAGWDFSSLLPAKDA